MRLSSIKSKRRTSKSKPQWKSSTYKGTHGSPGERAFSKVNKKSEKVFRKTGKAQSSIKMSKNYKKNLFIEEVKDIIFPFGNKPVRKVKKPIHLTSKKVYSKYQQQYRNIGTHIDSLCKKIESLIKNNKKISSIIKNVCNVSKVYAFIKVFQDTKQIIISIIDIKESSDRLIDLAEVDDHGFMPTKEEFSELVNIFKNTKEIIDSINDIKKQVSAITL